MMTLRRCGLGVVAMGHAVRWPVASLALAVVFAVITWVSGAFILPLWLSSGADRWVVASAAGVAVAGLAALGAHGWASRAGDKRALGAGSRAVSVGRDNTGIISTGDNATNVQDR
jgi:hypothetical protein